MGLKRKLQKGLISILAASLISSPALANNNLTSPETKFSAFNQGSLSEKAEKIAKSENIEENYALKLADIEFFGEERLKVGGEMMDRMISMMFTVPGRYKRVQFIGPQRFGKHKVGYKDLDWSRFSTQHFDIYAYDNLFIDDFTALSEQSYDELSEKFSSKFADLKVQSYFYMTRRDYEQTRFFPWLVPEGLGGFTFTEPKMKFKVVSLFEGDFSDWWHVWHHEYGHWHDLQLQQHVSKTKGAEHELPLWLIEGTAEHFSKQWDAEDETVIRDAYFNGFFFPIKSLWMVEGSWLMYKEGHFITKLIEEQFGRGAVLGFRHNLGQENFGKNVEATLGMTTDSLEKLVEQNLNGKYASLATQEDFVEKSLSLGNGKLLSSHDKFFITGKFDKGRAGLYINHLDEFNRITTERIAEDSKPENESLHYFKAGADMDGSKIVYAVRDNDRDVLRLKSYGYDAKGKDFNLGAEETFRFDSIEVIKSPVLLDDERIAFIGHKEGFAQVFVFNRKSKQLEQLTSGRSGYNSIDFCKGLNSIVVSKEEGGHGSYEDSLYMINLGTKDARKIELGFNARAPRVSPDGKRVAFVGDGEGVFNIYVYDLASGAHARLSDAKVAAVAPNWISDGEIIFNSVKMFQPTLHKAKVGGMDNLLAKALEAMVSVPGAASFNGLHTEGGSIFVSHNGGKLGVESFAFSGKTLYMMASASTPSQKRMFKFDGGLQMIGKGEETIDEMKGSNKNLESFLGQFEEVATIVKAAASEDRRYYALAVNNSLSFPGKLEKDFIKNFPVSFCIYDSIEKKLEWLPRVKGLSSASGLAAMDFVDDNLLIQFGDWLVYDMKEKKYFKPFKGIDLNLSSSSRDKRFIAAVAENKGDDDLDSVYIYDVAGKKEMAVGEFPEDYLTALRMSSDGRILVWDDEDKGNNVYYEINAGNGEMKAMTFQERVEVAGVGAKDKIPLGKIMDMEVGGGTVMIRLKTGKGKREKEVLLAGVEKDGRLILEQILSGYKSFELRGIDDEAALFEATDEYGKGIFAYFDKAAKFIGVSRAQIVGKELVVSGSDFGMHRINLETMAENMVVNASQFEAKGGKIVYASVKDGKTSLFSLDLMSGNEVMLGKEEEKMFLKEAFPGPAESRGEVGILPSAKAKEERIQGKFSKLPIDSLIFHIMGAISDSGGFLDTYLLGRDNLWDSMAFVDFTGNFDTFNFGSLAYADNANNNLFQAFIRHYNNDMITGLSYSHSWPLTRFVAVDASLSYEFQKMDYFDFKGFNHALKAGFGVGYDHTVWGETGPISGYRLFANFEAGYSLQRSNVNNIDFNMGYRQYFTPHELVTFAYRAEAGMSNGVMPTLFLLGGNQTLRGVPFDGLLGNNYFLVSGEVRSPLLKVAGAIFNEPLTPVSVLLMNYDIELGLYADVGSAWYQNPFFSSSRDDLPKLDPKYDIGWSINFTSPLGLRLRFNQVLWGNVEEWNFFFGYNW